MHAGRAAGIGRGEGLFTALPLLVVADYEIALHHVDLLPVVVHEGLGGEGAGLDLEEPRAAAALRRLVEIRGEDFLPEPRRIARRAFPSRVQVDFDEFEMLLRLHADRSEE